MPSRPLGPCTYPGCPGRATAGHGRCETHARQDRQRFDQQRGTAAERGYDAEWRRIRLAVLHNQPWCMACLAETGIHTLATDVDHEPRYPTLGPDHSLYELTSYCHRHHSARTSKQVR